MENNFEGKDILQQAFPKVFGNSQRQRDTQKQTVEKTLHLYIRKIDQQMNIIDNVQQKVRDLQKILKNYHVFQWEFFFEHSSVLIMEKQDDDEPVRIYISFPTEWDVGCEIQYQNQNPRILLYPENPNSFKYFPIGQCQFYEDLKKFKKEFLHCLRKIINQSFQKKEQNEKKNHRSPSWFSEAVKMAKKVFLKKDYNKYFQSKGGTVDVGNHIGITKPDTVFSTNFALINFFLQDQFLTSAIQISFKINLLHSFMKELKNHRYQQKSLLYQKLIQCLSDLRGEINSEKHVQNYDQQKIKIVLKVFEEGLLDIRKDLIQKQKNYEWKYAEMGKILPKEQNFLRLNLKHQISIYKNYQPFHESLFQSKFQFSVKKKDFISKLLRYKTITDVSLWIIFCQDVIFTEAINQLSEKIPFQNLDLQIVQSHYSPPVLQKFIQSYQESIQEEKKKLKTSYEINSHVILMRIIISIMGFEIIKRIRQNSVYEFSDYRLPFEVESIFINFQSQSYKARKAMKKVCFYFQQRKKLKNFFLQINGNINYFEYIRRVYEKSAQLKKHLLRENEKLEEQKEKLKQKIQDFYKRVSCQVQKIKEIQESPCSCYTQIRKKKKLRSNLNYYSLIFRKPPIDEYEYEDVKVLIKCERCKILPEQEDKLEKIRKQKGKYVQSKLPSSNPQIHQFFYSLPADIFGLLQILFRSQETHEQFLNYDTKIQIKNLHNLQIAYRGAAQKSFFYIQRKEQQIDELVSYPQSKIYIRYLKTRENIYSRKQMSEQSPSLKAKKMEQLFLMNPLFVQSNREHTIYCKIHQYPFPEAFVALGSLRVSEFTQIPVLIQNILERRIEINVLDNNSIISSIVRKTFLSLKTTQLSSQSSNSFKTQIIHLIQLFLVKISEIWKNEDVYSLPILGPIISLFVKIHADRGLKNLQNYAIDGPFTNKELFKSSSFLEIIMKKIIDEYKRIEKEESDQNKSCEQIFLCFAGLCCFTETIINSDNKLAYYFLALLILKQQKIDELKKYNAYTMAIQKYQFLEEKAIYSNIKGVKQYFLKQPQELTRTLLLIHPTISKNIFWKIYKETPEFANVFKGEGEENNIYYINLENGLFQKNYQSSSIRVPPTVFASEKFQSLFSKSNFLVVQTKKQNIYRIDKNFKFYFKENDLEDIQQIYFELEWNHKLQLSEVYLIFKQNKTDKEERWILLDHQTNETTKFPNVYLNQYYPWYCQQRKCITYREKQNKLESISKVSFIAVLIKESLNLFKVPKQYSTASITTILQSLEKFDNFILREKKRNPISYQIISTIQSENNSLLQIQTYNGQRKLHLHYFNYSFIQNETIGLIPEFQPFYKISKQPFYNKYLPWNDRNQICYIILEKIDKLAQTHLHEIKVLIPHFSIKNGFHIKPRKGKKTFFCYDLHDYFHDLRGKNRLNQLYLAQILVSINNQVRNPFTKFTPIEYAIKILRSCFNNRPLTSPELEKLQNIFKTSIKKQNVSLILISYCLAKVSFQLYNQNFSLPFHRQCKNKISFIIESEYQEVVEAAKMKYSWKIREGSLPFRQKIPENIIKILGIKISSLNTIKKWQEKRQENKNLEFKFLQKKDIKEVEAILNQIKQFKDSIMKKCIKNKNKSLVGLPENFYSSKEQDKLLSNIISSLEKSIKNFKENTLSLPKLINSEKGIQNIENKLKKIEEVEMKINTIFQKIQMELEKFDHKIGLKPILSTFDFTSLIKDENQMHKLCEYFSEKDKKLFFEVLKTSFSLMVQKDSLKRMREILKAETLDKTNLFRECQSPREQIEEKMYWLCFQVETKQQIWKSQYETYKTLINQKSGTVTQLNMGEGKTQIIIPMIILDKLYGEKNQQVKKTPRINLLPPLYQECRLNYYRALSITGFNIPIMQLPFDREVNLNKINIQRIKKSLKDFKNEMIIIQDQSSLHSIILKLREKSYPSKEETIFKNISSFDILDEVDALMSPRKSFIYSSGASSQIPTSKIRFQIHKIALNVFCSLFEKLNQKNLITFIESQGQAINCLELKEYPYGYRLKSDISSSAKKKKFFRKIMVQELIKNSENHFYLNFLEQMKYEEIQKIKLYLTDQTKGTDYIPIQLNQNIRKVLYGFRGVFAFGILQHSLVLRYGVNYGIPDEQRSKLKKLAVPYEASNVPSKKNQFSHPDISIILTFLSYYNTGLNEQNFYQCLEELNNLNTGLKKKIFQEWYKELNNRRKKFLQISKIEQIKFTSKIHKQKLFQTFKKCRKVINFWLTHCVFPKDLRQYEQSIVSSSWDHAYCKYSLGFSGTKDNWYVFPTYIQLKQSDDKMIQGTDGKMVNALMQNTLNIIDIEKNEKPQWMRFVETCLERDEKISCIIDVGALLIGQSLHEIVKWIAKSPLFPINKFKGISFCHENIWKIYDLNSHDLIERGTSISDHETFVIFDEYRTRGADIKMSHEITAVLSLSPTLKKEELMQAIGRLRKIGTQKIILLLVNEVKEKLKKNFYFQDQLVLKSKIQIILKWVCYNSCSQNKKYLLENAKLAKTHLQYLSKPDTRIKQNENSLQDMYSSNINYKTVDQLSSQYLKYEVQKQQNKEKPIRELLQRNKKYGENIKVQNLNYNNVTEKEQFLQREKQQQKEIMVEKFSCSLTPYLERNQVTSVDIDLENIAYSFSPKLKMSNNFLHCTLSSSLIHSEKYKNQLCFCYFVYLSKNMMCMITQRQASNYLKSGMHFGVSQNEENMVVSLFSLKFNNPYLKKHDLQNAYIQAKFFNGQEQFSKEEAKCLKTFINMSISKANETECQKYICYFLKRRRIVKEKYKGSTLSQICNELIYEKNLPSIDQSLSEIDKNQDINEERMLDESMDVDQFAYGEDDEFEDYLVEEDDGFIQEEDEY